MQWNFWGLNINVVTKGHILTCWRHHRLTRNSYTVYVFFRPEWDLIHTPEEPGGSSPLQLIHSWSGRPGDRCSPGCVAVWLIVQVRWADRSWAHPPPSHPCPPVHPLPAGGVLEASPVPSGLHRNRLPENEAWRSGHQTADVRDCVINYVSCTCGLWKPPPASPQLNRRKPAPENPSMSAEPVEEGSIHVEETLQQILNVQFTATVETRSCSFGEPGRRPTRIFM